MKRISFTTIHSIIIFMDLNEEVLVVKQGWLWELQGQRRWREINVGFMVSAGWLLSLTIHDFVNQTQFYLLIQSIFNLYHISFPIIGWIIHGLTTDILFVTLLIQFSKAAMVPKRHAWSMTSGRMNHYTDTKVFHPNALLFRCFNRLAYCTG